MLYQRNSLALFLVLFILLHKVNIQRKKLVLFDICSGRMGLALGPGGVSGRILFVVASQGPFSMAISLQVE